MEDLIKYSEFFGMNNFSCTHIGEFDQTFSVHSKIFILAQNREQSIDLIALSKKPDKDQSNILSNLANTQKRNHLKLASSYFCFNKYDMCIDHIITAWNLPVAQKSNMLTILPKTMTDNEYVLLLFASLFVRKGIPGLTSGYAESLIVSQFIENMPDLRKVQRYILKFINYVPKHLIEFLVSPSLIEEILAKNSVETKNLATESTLVRFSVTRNPSSTTRISTKPIQNRERLTSQTIKE